MDTLHQNAPVGKDKQQFCLGDANEIKYMYLTVYLQGFRAHVFYERL